MKTTKNFFRLTFLLLCYCSCFVFIHCKQNHISPSDLEAQKAIDLEVANFRYLCHLNELRADSIAQVVNKKYNYPYRLTAHFKVDNNNRRDMVSFYDVPYYGMTDGHKGFIFSLHKMKVKEISVFWGGFDNFLGFYDWDFTDMDDIQGWEIYLNELVINIPEHEKVIQDITERVKKERKTNSRIEFEEFGFAIIY